MSDPNEVTAALIRRQAAEFDGREIGLERAAQLAQEVDRLNRLVLAISGSAPDLLDDPASFAAILERRRDPWPGAAHDD